MNLFVLLLAGFITSFSVQAEPEQRVYLKASQYEDAFEVCKEYGGLEGILVIKSERGNVRMVARCRNGREMYISYPPPSKP